MISSKNGGETFSRAEKIADLNAGGGIGQLAVDPGSVFKDRLYAVWPSKFPNRTEIQLAYSSDQGKTWSKPVTINDDRPEEPDAPGANHLLSSIAVNKDGAVLVTWYDRREAKNNLGWQLRGVVSLDGGETFSASVPIADRANSYTPTTVWDLRPNTSTNRGTISLGLDTNNVVTASHINGLAVDADGTLHPTWIDNRTGVPQLWTASVKVNTPVAQHGGAGLAELEDVSNLVTIELSRPIFDRSAGQLNVTAQLKNLSNEVVVGPVKARVLAIVSGIGVAAITNADNGQSGAGAVWDFSSQLSGKSLGPMKMSAPKTLIFHVSDVCGLRNAALFTFDVWVYGHAHK